MSCVRIHRVGCGSWACPVCARRLGRELRLRLQKRLAGSRVVMATLTYGAEWRNGRQAYDDAKRNRRVSRCVMAWGASHQLDLRGRWLSKMELQSDGTVHFHVLIEVPWSKRFARRGEFDRFWRMGFSNLRQNVDVRYLTKYAAKPGGDSEALELSELPARGVRWVTASRGFWAESHGDVVDDEPDATWADAGGEVDYAGVFDDESEAYLVLRVRTCGVAARVNKLDCEGGVARVVSSVELPVAAERIRYWLRRESGEPDDRGVFVVSPSEWDRVLDDMGVLTNEFRFFV